MTIERSIRIIGLLVLITTATTIKAAENDESSSSSSSSLVFNLKLTNVDSSSAEFEVLDNNVTTVNYKISYKLTSNSSGADHKSETFMSAEAALQMQTNSMTLLAEQQKLVSDDETAEALKLSMHKDDLGEVYTSSVIDRIHAKSYEDVHRFVVAELDPNREYDIVFSITATEAFLSPVITGRSAAVAAERRARSSQKQLHFKFKTTYDYDSAAALACRNSMPNDSPQKQQQQPDPAASCYLEGTNCTQCKPNCYEVKQVRNRGDATGEKNKSEIKRILCEACPCDTSRSTGACEVVPPTTTTTDQSMSGGGDKNVLFASYPQIKCKQCIEPYVGAKCNDCQNEGVDFYKSESGECVRCFCNNNAALDVNPPAAAGSSSTTPRRRKCNSITGVCVDCMFNTTGRNCDQCLPGFVGDAVKRTCVRQASVAPAVLVPTSTPYPAPSSRNGKPSSNTNERVPMTIDPNEKYTYKSLALFSIYIFCALGLLVFTFLCIKSRSYSRQHMLKNGASQCAASPPSSSSSLGMGGGSSASSASGALVAHLRSLADSIDQSTKSVRSRVAIYFGSICPTTMRFVRVASNQPNSGDGTGLGSNDDDRLNLAEYQMFDDTLLNVNVDEGAFTYRATFTDMDDTQGDSRNPYRSLTVKT